MSWTKAQRKSLKALLGKAVRLRDKKCLRCGKTEKLQTSHIFSVGANKGMEFMLDNVKVLCYGCHIHWWHKEPVEGKQWLVGAIGKKKVMKLEAIKVSLEGKKGTYTKKTLEETRKRLKNTISYYEKGYNQNRYDAKAYREAKKALLSGN